MNDRPATTIHDVATLSELPIRTVSAVLLERGDIPENIRQQALTAAAKLAFTVPKPVLRDRGLSVAIAVPSATAWFYAQAAEAAQDVLADRGVSSVVVSLHRGQQGVAGTLAEDALKAITGQPAGLLLMGAELRHQQVEALLASPLTVVGIGHETALWTNVGIDDEQAAWTATSHLLELGHWNLGLLAGTDATMTARRSGFARALAEHDLEADPDLIVTTGTSMDGGFAAMNELLSNRGRPTAVLASCDEIAFGALKALRGYGLSAPDDISIIGIDDHPLSTLLGLTTVAQPVAGQAALAATLLADQLQNPESTAPSMHRLPIHLIERATTRRARVDTHCRMAASDTPTDEHAVPALACPGPAAKGFPGQNQLS